MANPKFFKSRKGGKKLSMDGFVYVRDGTSNSKVYWRCEDRSCKGRAITEGDAFVKQTGEHAHSPDPVNVEVLRGLVLV